MSKELEALDRLIENYYKMCQDTGYDGEYQRTNLPIDYEIIETALNEKINIENRLDEIFENHNIKSFDELNERLCDYNELKFDYDIKQKKLEEEKLLLSATRDLPNLYKKLKTLEIIKKINKYNLRALIDQSFLIDETITSDEHDLLRKELL